MPLNGSGTFTRPYSWVNEANGGEDIDATKMDADANGFATALSNAIYRDGQSTITSSIPFNNQKITGLGDATADQDAVNRRTGDDRYLQIIGGTITPVSVTASDIDLEGGSWFYKTAAGALTWTFSNPPATGGFGFILELTNGGAGTQTWPASVAWPGGDAPPLTVSGVDVLVFITRDGGTTWRGCVVMMDSQ
jgi:hypothetical protein